jgi:hypothetical protein
MHWFRSCSRLGSYLALFALAFQLAVSFGHVHLDHIAPLSADAIALVNAQPSSEEANAPPSPTGREDLADDLCPICTLIHLAGAMVPADKPPLPLPTILGELRNTEVRVFSMPSVKAPGVKVSRRQAYFCGCVTGAPARGCSPAMLSASGRTREARGS